jgi:hypothetical protein
MDPYIEACGLWEDFHSHLVEKIYDALASAVPERYFVQVGERSYIVLASENGKETRPFQPDVGVLSPSAPSRRGGVALAEPEMDAVTLRAFIDHRFRESFIEIYASEPEWRLVTSIEVLSPSNKRRGSEGWELYLRKRQALMLGSASLVEIDLLRGGQRFPMVDPWPDSPYYLLVCRQSRAPYCRVQRAYAHKPLPEIAVPLASPDPDVALALQPMIEAIYARSKYGRRIDYARPLTPPLAAEENALLAQKPRGEASGENPKARRKGRSGRNKGTS